MGLLRESRKAFCALKRFNTSVSKEVIFKVDLSGVSRKAFKALELFFTSVNE